MRRHATDKKDSSSFTSWYYIEFTLQIATKSTNFQNWQGWVPLWPKLSSQGYPKWSDDRDIVEKVVSWALLSAVKISGQSMKIWGNERIFASGGGEVVLFPPTSAGLCFRTLRMLRSTTLSFCSRLTHHLLVSGYCQKTPFVSKFISVSTVTVREHVPRSRIRRRVP